MPARLKFEEVFFRADTKFPSFVPALFCKIHKKSAFSVFQVFFQINFAYSLFGIITHMKSETGQIIFPNVDNIFQAAERLRKVAIHTPLQPNLNLSERYEANILLKREDLQIVRHSRRD